MKRVVIFLLILTISCSDGTVKETDLQFLDGYWSIEKVGLTDGSEKPYTQSGTIDYFAIKGDSGYRKKVQPRIDGSFRTSDDAIGFRFLQKQDAFFINYGGPEAGWIEEILKLNDSLLVVRNTDGITYYYRKFIPIKIE